MKFHPLIIIFDSTDLPCESEKNPLFIRWNLQNGESRVTGTLKTQYLKEILYMFMKLASTQEKLS